MFLELLKMIRTQGFCRQIKYEINYNDIQEISEKTVSLTSGNLAKTRGNNSITMPN